MMQSRNVRVGIIGIPEAENERHYYLHVRSKPVRYWHFMHLVCDNLK